MMDESYLCYTPTEEFSWMQNVSSILYIKEDFTSTDSIHERNKKCLLFLNVRTLQKHH